MGESTPRSSALTRLGHAVERAAAILFARSDVQAKAAGWQVDTTGRWNTSRVYRDPRYDQRRPRAAPDRARPDPARSWADPDQAWAGREPRRGHQQSGVGPARAWADPARSWAGREQDRSRR